MKHILMIMILCAAATGLSAQTGLFGISYGDHLSIADSLLAENGFVAGEIEGSWVKYYSDVNPMIDAVVLFVEPSSEIVVGWFVKYSSKNTEEQDRYVIDRLSAMHGESDHYDEETQQLIWFFSATRSLHVVYVEPKSLTVLYRDADFAKLFLVQKPIPENMFSIEDPVTGDDKAAEGELEDEKPGEEQESGSRE